MIAYIIIGILIILLLVCIFNFVIPMFKLWDAMKGIDYNNTQVDFTKIDKLQAKGVYPTKNIIAKFKHLVDVLCDRIIEVNEVIDVSERDGLTGCYNVQHLSTYKWQYEKANNFIVIFIDVNNLKRMNDTFGHEAGDALIISAAQKLSWWNKYGDVYRVGGDEFMIVVKDIPSNQVAKMINTWYPTVGILNRVTDGFRCVLSYGVAEGTFGSSFESVQKLADDRMYQMKVAIKKKFGEPMR